jgi:hypothetical protein
MVETPIYDGLVGDLGDTLAEVRALFAQHVDVADDDTPQEASAPEADLSSDQPAAAAA